METLRVLLELVDVEFVCLGDGVIVAEVLLDLAKSGQFLLHDLVDVCLFQVLDTGGDLLPGGGGDRVLLGVG